MKTMTLCKHTNLELIPREKNKMRCKHCHLTISKDELENGFCPECFETQGKKQYDFEEMKADANAKSQFRCEDCGIIIKTD